MKSIYFSDHCFYAFISATAISQAATSPADLVELTGTLAQHLTVRQSVNRLPFRYAIGQINATL